MFVRFPLLALISLSGAVPRANFKNFGKQYRAVSPATFFPVVSIKKLCIGPQALWRPLAVA